ncbi:MAG: hypothetical protein KGI60_03735 [Patescibacteria group bacterium]|nr:hypothetical protein [Patescibacteria group bacterium]
MSDLMKAIDDDMNAYVELCRRYNEEVRDKDSSPDCYGKHAKALKARAEKDEKRWARNRRGS